MWTVLRHNNSPQNNRSLIDVVFSECNEPCTWMFLEQLYQGMNLRKEYHVVKGSFEPTLIAREYEHVYHNGNFIMVMVFTMQDWIDLGFVSPSGDNLLLQPNSYRHLGITLDKD